MRTFVKVISPELRITNVQSGNSNIGATSHIDKPCPLFVFVGAVGIPCSSLPEGFPAS